MAVQGREYPAVTPETDRDTAGIRIPPPLYYIAGLIAGWLCGRWFPLSSFGGFAWRTTGQVLLVISFVPAIWAEYLFHRAKTSPFPFRPTSTIVFEGPFRHTRNPMYLSMAVFYLGYAIWMDLPWALVLLPVVLIAVQQFVIYREERYLRRKFGADYERYCKQVRRWI